ncbi:hypothetical protein N7527_006828 [Penicillium freii]|nr:hypothetical protein N7527_006828 [Penicillium freii]
MDFAFYKESAESESQGAPKEMQQYQPGSSSASVSPIRLYTSFLVVHHIGYRGLRTMQTKMSDNKQNPSKSSSLDRNIELKKRICFLFGYFFLFRRKLVYIISNQVEVSLSMDHVRRTVIVSPHEETEDGYKSGYLPVV